MLILILI
jgi:hypothetical protein